MTKKNAMPKIHRPYVQKDSPLWMLLPVLFFTSITLFIVRLYIYERNMNQFFWYYGSDQLLDFYSHARMVAIVTVSVISLFIVLGGALIQNITIKRSFVYIPMGVYSIFVVLSYVFSPYKEFALTGFNDRFEGTITLLAYMVILFYVLNIVNSEKNVKWALYCFAGASAIVCIVGVFQYFGFNFLVSDLGRKLITPSEYAQYSNTISSSVSTVATQFLYNQNYVSFYSMMPICIFSMFSIREQKIALKAGWAVLAALNLFNLWGSLSSGGILGLGVSFIVAIGLFGKRIIVWRKSIFILGVFFVIATALCLPKLLGELSSTKKYLSKTTEQKQSVKKAYLPLEAFKDIEIKSDIDMARGYYDEYNALPKAAPVARVEINEKALEEQTKKEVLYSAYAPLSDTKQKRVIDSIDTESDHIAFRIEGIGFQINVKGTEIASVTYEDGTAFGAENDMCHITTLSQGGVSYVFVNIDDTRWRFALLENGPVYVSPANKGTQLHNAPSIGFKGRESFGTYRGYIWSRTLPLLKDTLLIGHGADTFPIFFPQNDYVGRYNIGYYSQNTNIIVDKAHSLYLATGVNTGVISLLAIIVLFGYYIIKSFPIYKKAAYTSFLDYAGAGIFLGICGFIAAAAVNDSNVGVMPLFYGLLAIGIAINQMIFTKQTPQKQKESE